MKTSAVLKHFGSVNATAAALDVYHSTISQWKEYPPYLRQCEIELLTEGKLKREPKKQPPCHHHPETKVS